MILWRHADDLGATEGISEGILGAWSAGWLDGFSIFANGEGGAMVSEALAASQRPARIRVHLNLVEGYPSLAPSEVPDLVGRDGRFRLGFSGLWGELKSSRAPAVLAQVRAEWTEQLRIVRELVAPRPVLGVDSHLHVHALPALFEVAAELAAEQGLAEIRIPRESVHLAADLRSNLRAVAQANALKHLVLRRYARRNQRVARRLGLRFPDRFVGLLYSGAMSPEAVRAGVAAAERRGAEAVEVLFHPGRARPTERERWAGRPGLARYPHSVDRDRERQTLAELYGGHP